MKSCQDLSLAGARKGMSDTSTRSGMLWEVERILTECSELGGLPEVLLMENVIQVHGEGAIEHFNRFQLRLEELGYKNYWQDLIATDYGIPQTRNRTFMVSILGDYNYTFPKPIPLKKKLKDMLEDKVDEKYFISDKLLQYYNKKIDEGWRKELHLNKDTASTLCNPSRNQINDTFIGVFDIKESDTFRPTIEDRIHLDYPYSKTLCTRDDSTTIMLNKNDNLRIRKLTPRECFRLMGVKDEDFDKVAKNQSDSSLYHIAGDSIVVNVLMAIFKEMIK